MPAARRAGWLSRALALMALLTFALVVIMVFRVV
jgi:hypothetical protein